MKDVKRDHYGPAVEAFLNLVARLIAKAHLRDAADHTSVVEHLAANPELNEEGGSGELVT